MPSLELKRRQLSVEQSKAQEVLAQTQNQLAALELAIVEKLPMLSNQLVELTDIVKVTGVELGEEVVVIAQEEPPAAILPVPRTHAGSVSPEELKRQLEQMEIELDEIRAEHEALSRWIFWLSKNLARVEDQAARQEASRQGKEQDGIFMVQGWIPKPALKHLDAFAQQNQLAFLAEPCKAEDSPPTLMDNPPIFRGGFMLSSIYQGICCASAIAGSKAKPEIFGLSLAPAAIVEGFAVFALVFALVAAGGLK